MMAKGKRTKTDIMSDVRNAVRSKMVANNTVWYETEEGETVYRLHDTDILTFRTNGGFEISMGGWNTVTTRDRLDRYLPEGYKVSTNKGQAIFHTPNGAFEFVDRAYASPIGYVKTDVTEGFIPSYSDVKPYIERYIKKLLKHGMPEPSLGDPLLPPKEDGRYSSGEVMLWLGVPEVLEEYGEDPEAKNDYPYVFRTFIYNALLWCWNNQMLVNMTMNEFDDGSAASRQRVTRSIRRYIRACLGYQSS